MPNGPILRSIRPLWELSPQAEGTVPTAISLLDPSGQYIQNFIFLVAFGHLTVFMLMRPISRPSRPLWDLSRKLEGTDPTGMFPSVLYRLYPHNILVSFSIFPPKDSQAPFLCWRGPQRRPFLAFGAYLASSVVLMPILYSWICPLNIRGEIPQTFSMIQLSCEMDLFEGP